MQPESPRRFVKLARYLRSGPLPPKTYSNGTPAACTSEKARIAKAVPFLPSNIPPAKNRKVPVKLFVSVSALNLAIDSSEKKAGKRRETPILRPRNLVAFDSVSLLATKI